MWRGGIDRSFEKLTPNMGTEAITASQANILLVLRWLLLLGTYNFLEIASLRKNQLFSLGYYIVSSSNFDVSAKNGLCPVQVTVITSNNRLLIVVSKHFFRGKTFKDFLLSLPIIVDTVSSNSPNVFEYNLVQQLMFCNQFFFFLWGADLNYMKESSWSHSVKSVYSYQWTCKIHVSVPLLGTKDDEN